MITDEKMYTQDEVLRVFKVMRVINEWRILLVAFFWMTMGLGTSMIVFALQFQVSSWYINVPMILTSIGTIYANYKIQQFNKQIAESAR